MNENTGIYIHIPFCVKKCNYCDFVSGPYPEKVQNEYINRLIKEIKEDEFIRGKTADTIFFGGGTPSIINPSQIGRIIETISDVCQISGNAEISLESNPGTLTNEKLSVYKSFGINRLSMGLQSTNDEELKILGRIHKFNDFLKNYEAARNIGFDNINIDLMCAIPNQNFGSFAKGLEMVKGLEPEHVSVYSLIVEEGTPFYEAKLNLCDESEERKMIHAIPDILGKEYHQYEISNYSLKGYECKHNLKYWRRNTYVGFGVAAASLKGFDDLPDHRYKNTENVKEYIESADIPKTESEILDLNDMMSEYMILGLRLNEGISDASFKKMFGISIFDKYNFEISKHIDEGLLVRKGDLIYLNERGRDLSNFVMKDFI